MKKTMNLIISDAGDVSSKETKSNDAAALWEQLRQLWEASLTIPSLAMLTTEQATALVKDYIPDPRHRIRLHDLIHAEVERVSIAAIDACASLPSSLDAATLQACIQDYETNFARLLAMLIPIAFFGTRDHSRLLTYSISRLVYRERTFNNGSWSTISFYPALLAMYATGVAAVAEEQYHNVAAVLQSPSFLNPNSGNIVPTVAILHGGEVFGDAGKLLPVENAARAYTPASDYLFKRLKALLQPYCSLPTQYEQAFDLFEYLLSLVYWDRVRDTWAPVGRFIWKSRLQGTSFGHGPMAEFMRNEEIRGENGRLVQAGFFNGSAARFKEVKDSHLAWITNRS